MVGETLAANVEPAAATAEYQWKRSKGINGLDWEPIPDATSNNYTISEDDLHEDIIVKATGTGNYTGTIESDPLGPVAHAPVPSATVAGVTVDGTVDLEITEKDVVIGTSDLAVTQNPDAKFEIEASGTGQAGDQTTHTVSGVAFNMRLAPAATFPTGINDDGTATIDNDLWIAETPVTYELWYSVRVWAEAHGYHFQNVGREGGKYDESNPNDGGLPSVRKNEPVTMVRWRDAVVWLNALSEMDGQIPICRTTDGTIIHNSRDANADIVDNAVQTSNNGFRLPTSMEWELAARWIGTTDPGLSGQYGHGTDLETQRKTTTVRNITCYWSPGNYASGATDKDAAATQAVGMARPVQHPASRPVDP